MQPVVLAACPLIKQPAEQMRRLGREQVVADRDNVVNAFMELIDVAAGHMSGGFLLQGTLGIRDDLPIAHESEVFDLLDEHRSLSMVRSSSIAARVFVIAGHAWDASTRLRRTLLLRGHGRGAALSDRCAVSLRCRGAD